MRAAPSCFAWQFKRPGGAWVRACGAYHTGSVVRLFGTRVERRA